MRPPLTAATGVAEIDRYVEAAERLAIDVASSDLRAPVPTCPGWTVWDLVVHVGNVHAWAATIVETGASAVEQNDEPEHRRPKVASAWYAAKAEDLYEALRSVDLAKPCWNFAFGTGEAAFWARRQMHETTVHLLDLASVTGAAVDLDPALCADGVDEVLTVFGHRMHERGYPATLTAPVSLVATDTGDAWTVTPRPVVPPPGSTVPQQVRGSATETAPALTDGPPLVVDRLHPAADRVEATAEMLYRLLWKRLPGHAAGPRGASFDPLADPSYDGVFAVSGDRDRVRAYLGSRLVP